MGNRETRGGHLTPGEGGKISEEKPAGIGGIRTGVLGRKEGRGGQGKHHTFE